MLYLYVYYNDKNLLILTKLTFGVQLTLHHWVARFTFWHNSSIKFHYYHTFLIKVPIKIFTIYELE